MVVAIISVLAAIALPQFIAYRTRAIDTQMKSDLKNAAMAMESYFAEFKDLSCLSGQHLFRRFQANEWCRAGYLCDVSHFLYTHGGRSQRLPADFHLR